MVWTKEFYNKWDSLQFTFEAYKQKNCRDILHFFGWNSFVPNTVSVFLSGVKMLMFCILIHLYCLIVALIKFNYGQDTRQIRCLAMRQRKQASQQEQEVHSLVNLSCSSVD